MEADIQIPDKVEKKLPYQEEYNLAVGENSVDQNREQLVKVGFHRAFTGMPNRISVQPSADAGTYNLESVYAR